MASIGRRLRCGEQPGLDTLEVSPPMKLDASPCREDHELSQRPVAKADGFDRDPNMPGTPRKRLVLRDLCASLSIRVGREEFIGDSALEEEDNVAGPSSHLEVVAEWEGASSSCVCRRVRGRKVVELLTEAVADDGLLMFIGAGASFGVQAALTFGCGEITPTKW